MVLRQSQLLINSINRDSPQTSSTSNFWITPVMPVFDVVKIELRAAIIEDGIYNVTTDNNRFGLYTSLDGFNMMTEIAIPPAYYDPSTLAKTILNTINKSVTTPSGEAINNVSINTNTDVLYIESTSLGFILNFVDTRFWGAATLLGFNAGNFYNSSTVLTSGQQPVGLGYTGQIQKPAVGATNGLQSPSKITLRSYDYVLLQSSKLGNRITSAAGFGAFALIPLYAGDNAPFISNTTSFIDSTYFIQKTKLDRIDIAIVDAQGLPVNLQGNNVSLLFDIVQDIA